VHPLLADLELLLLVHLGHLLQLQTANQSLLQPFASQSGPWLAAFDNLQVLQHCGKKCRWTCKLSNAASHGPDCEAKVAATNIGLQSASAAAGALNARATGVPKAPPVAPKPFSAGGPKAPPAEAVPNSCTK